MIVTYPNDKSLMIDLAFARLGNCLRWPFVFLQLSAFAVFSHGSPLEKLDGVGDADVSLDGTWHFQIPAPEGFGKELAEPTGWKTMPVPGDVFREGHPIKENIPMAYKRKVSIPADFA